MRSYRDYLTQEGQALLRYWARQQLSPEEIARRCGVAPETLSRWKRDHPEIARALAQTRELADAMVEDALLRRALGYEYQEARREFTEKTGEKQVETAKHVPGDATAQLIWLKNRRPDRWQDKPQASSSQFDAEAHAALIRALQGEEAEE